MMTTNKPYLLRAIHEWLTDNDDVPHILVDGGIPELLPIQDFVQEGKITLNVGYDATQSLLMDNDFLSFQARFAGKSVALSLPIEAVLGIYGRDSGQGMMFPETGQELPDSTTPDAPSESGKPGKKSHLTLLKE